MAKINFGGVVQDARGKQNGLVYSKNGSGAYVKRKVTPVNPATPAQGTVRSTFGTLSKNWSSLLTDAQRAAWAAFATAWPRKDVFGNTLTLNGLNMYIALNATLINAAQPGILSPPADLSVVPIPTTVGAAVASTGLTFTQVNADDASGNLYYIYGAAPLPPGRAVSSSLYRFLGTKPQNALADSAVLMAADYIAVFGDWLTGQAICLLVSTVNIATGAVSVGQPYRYIST